MVLSPRLRLNEAMTDAMVEERRAAPCGIVTSTRRSPAAPGSMTPATSTSASHATRYASHSRIERRTLSPSSPFHVTGASSTCRATPSSERRSHSPRIVPSALMALPITGVRSSLARGVGCAGSTRETRPVDSALTLDKPE